MCENVFKLFGKSLYHGRLLFQMKAENSWDKFINYRSSGRNQTIAPNENDAPVILNLPIGLNIVIALFCFPSFWQLYDSPH